MNSLIGIIFLSSSILMSTTLGAEYHIDSTHGEKILLFILCLFQVMMIAVSGRRLGITLIPSLRSHKGKLKLMAV